jgi:plasmid stabilization system protein ParE
VTRTGIRSHVYSRQAEAELREIVLYTTRQWGASRARAYARQIDAAAAAVAAGQGVFKEWGEVLPGLRVSAAGSHYVFCVHRPDRPALILAILHQRMDLMARLKERLA